MEVLASRTRIVLAFAAVYLIWGSTYLAIRYAIETLPPLLMAGGRFMTAGAILYALARRAGAPPPERRHILPALLIGGLMLLVGNGGVVLAERTVPSGLAALVIGSVPMWMEVLDRVRRGAGWPTGPRAIALIIGFAAVALLVGPSALAGGDWLGMGLLVLAALSWTVGSLYSRSAPRPASALMSVSLQMLAGGGLQLLCGTALGEWAQLHPEKVSVASAVALAYLVVFGSLIGFTAYAWLLQVVPPTLAATYAYVNPIVAVLLGWLVAGEPLTPRVLISAAGIVVSVVLLTRTKK
jgi:drug/metabolite transporter (DMT)-like permease